MEFRLLGPLEVVERDRLLPLGGMKPRSLLAVLLLHANHVVSVDRLTDQLWGGHPPATAAKSIQVYVSKLRKGLGDGRLATRPPGYVLNADPSELDLARFERLLGEAQRADPDDRSTKLREALALWRGPALADLAYEPFAQSAIARLEELRLMALEQRIDADLTRGHNAEVVAELQALVAANPLREHLRCQLMLALYRSGRQAEALEAYRAACRMLADELGLEPGGELRELERAILQHEPALDVAPALDFAPAPVATAPVPDRSLEAVAPTRSDRSILVVTRSGAGLAELLSLGRPLTSTASPRELIIASVVEPSDLRAATAALADYRDALLADGLAARTAAFSSPAPAEDVARVAALQDVDLLLMDASSSVDGDLGLVLERAPCDVALLVQAGGPLRSGPVIVPFGAGWHDWAALEVGAWVARATGAALQLVGAESQQPEGGSDASRLLADASLIVQRTAGVMAEPLLARPGRQGIAAVTGDAGLLVVGLAERWRHEGLGRLRTQMVDSPWAPTLLVRRGPRPGGLAPPETRTRFGWSLTGGGL
jgi:DNA-binding SARP family transcriptional activator